MKNHSVDFIEIKNLLFSGEGQQIFVTIQKDADAGAAQLKEGEQLKELDFEKAKTLRLQVKENLEEASHLRFTLNAVDQKINREKRAVPLLKDFCDNLKKASKPDTLEELVDFLIDLEIRTPRMREDKSLLPIQSYATQSLQCRVQLAWCWDEILEAQRSALIARAITLAHQITEIAILLQESDVIDSVRSLLTSLNLSIPEKIRLSPFMGSTAEMKSILTACIATLEQTRDAILRLDRQRDQIKHAVNELTDCLEEDSIPERETETLRPFLSPAAKPDPKEYQPRGNGMVYPSLRLRKK
ncbi:MAG: hypothetical protein ACE15F_23740 [bacterium]